MPRDPQTASHLEWLGFVQPVGLVVSIPALLNAQAYINKNIAPVQQRFLASLVQNGDGEPIAKVADYRQFLCNLLEWQPADLVEVTDSNCDRLEVLLPEYQERLRPSFVVPQASPKEGQIPWQMIIQAVDEDKFDESSSESKHGWFASPQAKFERLLRETEIPVGLLVNSDRVRLVYAPRGESSGHITFLISDMMAVAGRPILAAFYMLLSVDRLFLLQQESQRLPAILADSRKYQNTVSTELAQQVLAALFELLRGFQAANDQSNGKLLESILNDEPNRVYNGLLTVLMRLVFILYAEDRNLLSNSSVYSEYYSVTRLYERLREDTGQYPDTMDHRYGAWAQLLTLFRLLHEGGSHGNLQIPERKGHLFDPGVYPFLEGHFEQSEFEMIPRVSDGVVFRVLNNLLILEGERLSYRALDVEQIGSVYEAIMGFTLQVATGTSIAIKPAKQHGAPATINLDELLKVKPADRCKRIAEWSDQKLTGTTARSVKEAVSIQDLLAALEPKVAKAVTPHAVPRGNMILQPSNERRKSGSHYTPRSLTEPIVRTTLKPVIDRLGANPTPEQILDIKVCDPAMGSGAFLVESCRQLGDELVKAWFFHKALPEIPADEDELLHARRLIAQRCLYGVDKNPMAVNLAKLSLWLATLARDHAFTFLDHNLRSGDSLVGLTKDQILRYHWQTGGQRVIDEARIRKTMQTATGLRKRILENADKVLSYQLLEASLKEADRLLEPIRLVGDSIVAAFFGADKDRSRNEIRTKNLSIMSVALEEAERGVTNRGLLNEVVHPLYASNFSIEPFHWEIEFPEVFERGNPGFDFIVGNPPFLGGSRISGTLGDEYLQWLLMSHIESHGNGDLVAHFFRSSFSLIRNDGVLGLLATNTIAQGDTRTSGLQWICINGGTIFAAIRRLPWPGDAKVTVSVVHIRKGQGASQLVLDSRPVPKITAFLYHTGGDLPPVKLVANADKSFNGMKIYGQGFSFDDNDPEANSLQEMQRLIDENPRNAERIFPYIGGEEITDDPAHAFHRYAIDFNDMSLEEAANWPDLLQIVREKVKPFRDVQKRDALRNYWWHYGEKRPGLRKAIGTLSRTLVCCQTSKYLSFAFLPTNMIYSQKAVVVALDSYAAFACLQSRVHLEWAYLQGSSLEDRPVYASSDCFETFPFPNSFDSLESLEIVGLEYYEYRQNLMLRNNEGFTKTYNRFHDPLEQSPEIVGLRQLQDRMDRAVLAAYGWCDLDPICDYFVQYEDDSDDSDEPRDQRDRRKPYRWTWSEQFRDEVYSRLLDLNGQRAVEEALARPVAKKQKSKTKDKKSKLVKPTSAKPPQEVAESKQLLITQVE